MKAAKKAAAKTKIRAEIKKLTAEQGVAKAEHLKRVEAAAEWVQVGMDPERHGYFYTRDKIDGVHRPVTSGEEVIQIGPLVLVKKPVFAVFSQFLYQPDPFDDLDFGFDTPDPGSAEPRAKKRPTSWELFQYQQGKRKPSLSFASHRQDCGRPV